VAAVEPKTAPNLPVTRSLGGESGTGVDEQLLPAAHMFAVST